MATVLPFAGIRPQVKLADKVAAPPYDVISSKEARELARDNPFSFLHISKPEIDFSPEVDVHSAAVYEKGRENYLRFLADGVLIQDESACFYLYRQTLGNHAQTGLVALVSADDYEKNIIKKHESTRPEKENDRVAHMQSIQAQTGPVFLTYRSDSGLTTLMESFAQQAPLYDFVSDSVRHQFWAIPDSTIQQKISAEFEAVPSLFVADGHHRSAAAVRYRDLRRAANKNHRGNEDYNYFMAVLFPHDQLSILGYHRLVSDLGSYDVTGLIGAIAKEFDVTVTDGTDGNVMPENPGQFSLYLDHTWYRLEYRAGTDSLAGSVEQLDVSILQNSILSPLLGISDPRTDSRLDFIGGIKGQNGLEQAVDRGVFAAAFACYPVQIESLLTIAEQGKLMPPKSTWFEPKLKSGLVMHGLD